MHFTTLHDYTAFNPNIWNPLHSIGMHFTRLHGIHCIQSGCMESTAFNRDAFYQAAWNPCIHHTAWTPLHTIGIHCATMHGILCIESGCFWPWCIKSTAFNHAAWNPLHSIMLHNIHCIQNVPFLHAAWNPLHSIGMHFTSLHGVHCIQSQCMESTAFHRDALGHAS